MRAWGDPVHSRPGQPVTGGYAPPVAADAGRDMGCNCVRICGCGKCCKDCKCPTRPIGKWVGDPIAFPAAKPTNLIDCAACSGTGLRQTPRNDGSLLCRGCNGAGKQRV